MNLLRRPMSPREIGEVLSAHSGEVGIVFGREGSGLTNHELSLCDAIVTIPAAPAYPTLNLSHAAAVIFYELHHSGSGVAGDELADQRVRNTILDYLAESLALIGLEEYKIGLASRGLRNMMGRSAIRRREGSLLAGALRQISQALSNSYGPERHVSGLESVKLPMEQ